MISWKLLLCYKKAQYLTGCSVNVFSHWLIARLKCWRQSGAPEAATRCRTAIPRNRRRDVTRVQRRPRLHSRLFISSSRSIVMQAGGADQSISIVISGRRRLQAGQMRLPCRTDFHDIRSLLLSNRNSCSHNISHLIFLFSFGLRKWFNLKYVRYSLFLNIDHLHSKSDSTITRYSSSIALSDYGALAIIIASMRI